MASKATWPDSATLSKRYGFVYIIPLALKFMFLASCRVDGIKTSCSAKMAFSTRIMNATEI